MCAINLTQLGKGAQEFPFPASRRSEYLVYALKIWESKKNEKREKRRKNVGSPPGPGKKYQKMVFRGSFPHTSAHVS